jgi:competence CoiA-like predicted nuclease
MSFVALRKDTRERVDITQYPSPKKEALKHFVLICQKCEGILYVKEGDVRAAHFAHMPGVHCEAAEESQKHRNGKLYLRDHLKDIFPEYAEARFDFEYHVPGVDRIIDLLVTLPDGRKIAHEVQLASITTKTLWERTDDYAQAGISTVWWLGGSAHTTTNVQWCLQQFEAAYILQYQENIPVATEVLRKPPPTVIPPLREEQAWEEEIETVTPVKIAPH